MPADARAQPKRGVFTAEVVDNVPLCREHFQLVLRCRNLPPSRPGQFIQLRCRERDESPGPRLIEWDPHRPLRITDADLRHRRPLLRRPFSLAGREDRDDGTARIEIIYRTVGIGTNWLAGIQAGGELSLMGPLGNGFRATDRPRAALVGGGVGIPPLLYLAEVLRAADKEVFGFCGVGSKDLLPLRLTGLDRPRADGFPNACLQHFAGLEAQAAIATDDGSLGYPGLISEAFGRWLTSGQVDPAALAVYACGPEPMMRAVADVCLPRAIPCQLAMERHMACGVGTCQSCIVKVRDDSDEGWRYKLCCTDGPVFEAGEILWD